MRRALAGARDASLCGFPASLLAVSGRPKPPVTNWPFCTGLAGERVRPFGPMQEVLLISIARPPARPPGAAHGAVTAVQRVVDVVGAAGVDGDDVHALRRLQHEATQQRRVGQGLVDLRGRGDGGTAGRRWQYSDGDGIDRQAGRQANRD